MLLAPVHNSGKNFRMFKILAMLLSHCVMLLKFVLYSFSARYFSKFAFIYRVGLLGSSCKILTKFAFINRDISSVTSSKLAGSILL